MAGRASVEGQTGALFSDLHLSVSHHYLPPTCGILIPCCYILTMIRSLGVHFTNGSWGIHEPEGNCYDNYNTGAAGFRVKEGCYSGACFFFFLSFLGTCSWFDG